MNKIEIPEYIIRVEVENDKVVLVDWGEELSKKYKDTPKELTKTVQRYLKKFIKFLR